MDTCKECGYSVRVHTSDGTPVCSNCGALWPAGLADPNSLDPHNADDAEYILAHGSEYGGDMVRKAEDTVYGPR